jgi:hypothetical protein
VSLLAALTQIQRLAQARFMVANLFATFAEDNSAAANSDTGRTALAAPEGNSAIL